MVGATGFEPATSCSRSRRATGLRYAPPNCRKIADAPGGTRIPNLLIRSQMLYPIELRALSIRRLHRPASRSNADADNRRITHLSQPARRAVAFLRAGKNKALGSRPRATQWAVQDSNL